MGTSASGQELGRAEKGRGEQAHRVRSFLAGKAHSTKTAGQYLTGSQQSHTIHHALGPQAACTVQHETQDRHRAPGAPYLPPLQTEPCFSRSLTTVRHIPISSHCVPVSQQLPTPLSSGEQQDSQTPTDLCWLFHKHLGTASSCYEQTAWHSAVPSCTAGLETDAAWAPEHNGSFPPHPADPRQLHTGYTNCKRRATDIFKT